MFCQVVIDIVHQNVAKPFTYAVPEGMRLEPGHRVAVPFGPGKKEGIVIRPVSPVYSPTIGAELSMKVVNNNYLLKQKD